MRKVKERKPKYFEDGKAIYNPGLVDSYQKPWYERCNSHIEYYGRFCKEGYPGEVRLEFDSLRELINKIPSIDKPIKDEIMIMIEEMEDANYAQRESHINSLPSAD